MAAKQPPKNVKVLAILRLLFFTEREVDHNKGFIAAELTQLETVSANTTQISYINKSGEITYAIDKHYATLV